MPTVVSADGLSIAQAPPLDRPCRSTVTEAAQKKLKRLVEDRASISGHKMKSVSATWFAMSQPIAPGTTDPVVFDQPTRRA